MENNDKINEIIRTERGWAGHFIRADRCLFRRNTLLQCGNTYIIVSTVGMMVDIHKEGYPNKINFTAIGCDRNYETMAFYSREDDNKYHDADVTKQINFDSPWMISEEDRDNEADIMHETVVSELTEKLKNGELKEYIP